MKNELLKKLLLNALNRLDDHLGNESCNDLFPDDILLTDISKDDMKEIQEEWTKLPDSKDWPTLNMDYQLLGILKESVKKM